MKNQRLVNLVASVIIGAGSIFNPSYTNGQDLAAKTDSVKVVSEQPSKESLNSRLINKEIDTLVLGCTHYPVLIEIIQKIMGPEVTLVDSGTAAALEVETYLNGIGLRNDSNQIGEHQYYVSDLPAKFKTIAERFLGTELDHIEKIDVDQLIKH